MIAKKIKAIIKTLCVCAVIVFLSAPVDAVEIRISMAASLKDVLSELCDAFAKGNPGITFQKNSGASGALAKQIESGAPADIFFSANLEWMDYLEEKDLVEKKNVNILAYNKLVFIGRSDLNVKTLNDLVSLGKIAIGSPKSAPAGEYAITALSNAGITKELDKKLVMAKDVLECIMYTERGEVDGAFVYRTDALDMSGKVKMLFEVPQDLYPRVTYPMGLTNTGAGNDEAKRFFKYLQSETAKAVLSKCGFMIE